MTNSSGKQDKDKQGIDEAWIKLQSKLADEPINPSWAEWGQIKASIPEVPVSLGQPELVISNKDEAVLTKEQEKTVTSEAKKERRPRRLHMTRRRKLGVVAASVAMFAVILATPIGNTAMASILNQFRMQQVTVVNESDLNNIFNQVTDKGGLNQSINQFGEFSNTDGTSIGEIPADQLQEKLGYSAKQAALVDGKSTVMVGAAQDITFNLKVDEVNKVLKRIGAEHLLPESIDGKPITLHLPESVSYDLSTDEKEWANLSQMNTPVLKVDPSIKVDEAVQAVINFPLLPDYLKTSLVQSQILSGEIPMPIIAGDSTEQVNVGNTTVIVDNYEYSRGRVYQATWVQNGQLFSLSGEMFSSKEKLLAKVQELIES